MAKRYHGEEVYSDESARRTREMEEAGMIGNDRSAVANMPSNIVYKSYPKAGYGLDGDLDDSIVGIDYQMDDLDGKKRMAHTKPKKV